MKGGSVAMAETAREWENAERVSAEVWAGARRQRLSVAARGPDAALLLTEGDKTLRCWPLTSVTLKTDLPEGGISVEAGGESLAWTCAEAARAEVARAAGAAPLSDEALGALLGAEPEPEDADAERWVRRLADRLARLDALNVAGMLAAATEGGGARLAARLEAGGAAGAALAARLRRLEAHTRAAPAALTARCGAARADASARALLDELRSIFQWLEAPALQDLDSLSEVSLASSEGRARALAAAAALRTALRGAGRATRARALRLGGVRERLRRLGRARDALAAALARHLNNALIHHGNEAAHIAARHHHAHLHPYAPFMRWLKDMDDKAYEGLVKVYVATWSRVYEREVRGACEAARAALAQAPPEKADELLDEVYVATWSRVYEREVRGACEAARAALAQAPPEKADELLDEVLTLVENICNAEQDFCTQFFCLDVDIKGEEEEGEGGSGGSVSSGAEGGEAGAEAGEGEGGGEAEGEGGGGEAGEGGEARRASSEAKRMMAELFPALDTDLVALVGHIERHDPYGAMRALACVGRRVLGAGGAGEGGAGGAGAAGGEARWARAALAAVAVAAKRGADRAVAERLAALPDAVKQAAKKPKCGVLSFIPQLEEMSTVCEAIFAKGRRADLDRWYVSLAAGMVRAVAAAEHPRTPRAALLAENFHRLHRAICALRVPALDALRRDTRLRYNDALRAYVTQYFGRPLDKLTQFFEGVAEAVAMGVREDEVCYRAAFSKHELRRLLAMYPAHEVRKSLHRLYRTVEKHFSEEGGLLQVVWRAMQEEFIAQHVTLQARMAACYAGAGLALPLSTQDILDAFSDIAREH